MTRNWELKENVLQLFKVNALVEFKSALLTHFSRI